MASDVSPNWLLSVPSCTSLVAGRQAWPGAFLSFFATMGVTPRNLMRAQKNPGLWRNAKRPGLLARPFSDLFNVAASRPAKSPRGWINVARAAPRQAFSAGPPLVNPGEKGKVRMTDAPANAKEDDPWSRQVSARDCLTAFPR